MGYQVIEPNNDPLYKDFMNHKIVGRTHKPLEEYKELYSCSGLWNNGCKKTTIEEMKRTIDWMCTGDWYEDSTGTKLFLHAYSGCDMW